MTRLPKKVAVIGLDCAITPLVEKHISEGHLPTFKKLLDNGVLFENALANYPTVTPPNWAGLATGALDGTHGIFEFHTMKEGAQPDNSNTVGAFSSERVKAEYIWDAADREGKKCVVLNYPGSWPSNMKNGIMVGGCGLSIGADRDNQPGLSVEVDLCHDQLITTGFFANAIRGEFEKAKDWVNVPDIGEDALEMKVKLKFPEAKYRPAPTTWYVLVRELNDDGYDTVTLSPTKDMNASFCTLKAGEWSEKVFTEIELEDGNQRKIFFRCKLLELSDDAEDFRLYLGDLCATQGWSSPPEYAEKISSYSKKGTFGVGGGLVGYTTGWYDLDTYVEINEQYTEFLADAAEYVLQNNEWDLFYMHSHPIDWIYHAVLNDMDPDICKDEAKRNAAWKAHLEIYETQDWLLKKLMALFGDETLVVAVSDHGAVPDGTMVNPYDILVPTGLCAKPEKFLDTSMGGYYEKVITVYGWDLKPDPSISKAIPVGRCFVYVNLKGRDPEGIVEPEDYENVQQEIIDALYGYVDPISGKRPIALALTKQDARMIGLYGDNLADVIYALYPWFGAQHGCILPTAQYGVGSLTPFFAMAGPGIKKGYRVKRNAWCTDLVPTICHLLDFPLPEDTEGAVLYQALEDPNCKSKELISLRSRIAEFEKDTSK